MRTSKVSREASAALAARMKKRPRSATGTTATSSTTITEEDSAPRRSSSRLSSFALRGTEAKAGSDPSTNKTKSELEDVESGVQPSSTSSGLHSSKRQRRAPVNAKRPTTPTKETIKVQKLSVSPSELRGIRTELPSPPTPSTFESTAPPKTKRDPDAPLPPPPTFNALPLLPPDAPGPTKRWATQYNLISAQRGTFVAAVDTMGCERLFDTKAPPAVQRFQTLISLLLSSQTKDPITAAAIRRLQSELDGGLTIEAVLNAEESRIDELIRAVGFHNTKAKNMKRIAVILTEEHGGDVPDTIEELLKLPGIGPKMGHLTLQAAHGITTGIGVDTHVHRLSNLLGWVKNTKNPEETRVELEKFLPKERWREINSLLVGFGQVVCGRVRRCGDCWLAREGVCSKSTVRKDKWGQVKEEVKVQVGDVEDFGKIPIIVKEELQN